MDMRKLLLTTAALAASLISTSLVSIGSAQAAPAGAPLGRAADSVNILEPSQFFWGGREYCWYPDGWHGPGFYWCGYAWRSGFGWGGPIGWRGWRAGPRVVGPRVVGPRVMGPRVMAPRMVGPRVMGPRMGGGGGGYGRRR